MERPNVGGGATPGESREGQRVGLQGCFPTAVVADSQAAVAHLAVASNVLLAPRASFAKPDLATEA
jgi:hypothetical protein